MATADGKPVKLVWRSYTDGYFYEDTKGQLYRADHSCDGRHGEPLGPDGCDHEILIVDIAKLKAKGVWLEEEHGAASLPLLNGKRCLVEVDKGLQFILKRHPEIKVFARFGTVIYQLEKVTGP